MRTIGLAALAAAAVACAGAGETRATQPSRFQDVRSLVLVRGAGDQRGQGAKDPLDGLDESLRARGFATRVVELGAGRPPELAGLERLFEQLELRAAAGRLERVADPISSLGRDARATVAALGADAVASYHRLDRRRGAALPAPSPGTRFPAPPPPDRPAAALVLVHRDGRVAVFAWGDAGALEDPSVPLNAAEAIDLLVEALAP
jgi:hypothetical protein